MQTGTVLYGNKDKGWIAIAGGKKVILPPDGGRIYENGDMRPPGPAEKKPRPSGKQVVVFLSVEQEGTKLRASEWALQSS